MLSKASLLSFIGSSVAHGALIVGIGGLHTPASVQVQPAPISMELILSKGENAQGLGVILEQPDLRSQSKQDSSPTAQNDATIKVEKETKQNKPVQKNSAEQARAVPGNDIGPIHSGANIKTHGPCIVNNFPPKYPRWARRQGYEGTSLLRVLISKDGKAQKIEIKESSGYSILDQAAIKTVNQWKFYPAKKMGINRSSQMLIPIVFEIKG